MHMFDRVSDTFVTAFVHRNYGVTSLDDLNLPDVQGAPDMHAGVFCCQPCIMYIASK